MSLLSRRGHRSLPDPKHFFLPGIYVHAGNAMKITRLYTGSDNESHFEEIDMPLEDREEFGRFSIPQRLKALFFREIPPGWHYTWHNVVCREYVIMLEGSAEIETGCGEKRVFRKGDVLLAEDCAGRGHRTRVIGKKPWRQAFITLP